LLFSILAANAELTGTARTEVPKTKTALGRVRLSDWPAPV
jgi:hypothetical protein